MASRTPPLRMDDPVVVALSAPGEARWGFHQFPALSRLPDGRILLMYADAADASETHGELAPSYVSADGGLSWEAFSGEPAPVRPHYSVSEVFDKQYLVMPSHRYLNYVQAGAQLPSPVSEADVYGIRRQYRVADMPESVQEYFRHIPAKRWRPETGAWQDETIEFDMTGRLTWVSGASEVLPRTFFERHLTRFGGELLYADYRSCYAMQSGAIAAKGGSSLMVSTDNGQSFTRRATIAIDPTGQDINGEPVLSATRDGRLVCVIRKTDHEQKPMAITWSADQGHTWSPPQSLCDYGVWPCLQLLGNGALVLSYGRPGVHLRVSVDGNGESWSEPVTVVEGDHGWVTQHTCGYTSMLEMDADSFLFAYSDFLHTDESGVQRKAIFVRRVRIDN